MVLVFGRRGVGLRFIYSAHTHTYSHTQTHFYLDFYKRKEITNLYEKTVSIIISRKFT